MKNHRTGFFVIDTNTGWVWGWSKERRDAELKAKQGQTVYAAGDIIIYKYCPGWYKIKCLRQKAIIY